MRRDEGIGQGFTTLLFNMGSTLSEIHPDFARISQSCVRQDYPSDSDLFGRRMQYRTPHRGDTVLAPENKVGYYLPTRFLFGTERQSVRAATQTRAGGHGLTITTALDRESRVRSLIHDARFPLLLQSSATETIFTQSQL
jgi:hypothetical protein